MTISDATKLLTVKSFPLPLVSSPIVCPALFAKVNLTPLVPYVIDPNDLGIHLPVDVSVNPKVSGP